jgi:hypothetical protein
MQWVYEQAVDRYKQKRWFMGGTRVFHPVPQIDHVHGGKVARFAGHSGARRRREPGIHNRDLAAVGGERLL